MPRKMFSIFLAAGMIAGCQTPAPPAAVVTEFLSIPCPAQRPPDIPPLPARPDTGDLRDLEIARYHVEAWHAGVASRQAAWIAAWEECR